MEDASEASEIVERVTKEAVEEAEVKAVAKSAHAVSSAGTLSTSTVTSTDASAFTKSYASNISVVYFSIRSGYTVIIIML